MQGLDLMLQNENLTPATFNLVFGNAILHHKERDLIVRLESTKIKLGQKIDLTKTDDDTVIFLQLKDMKLDWQNWTMLEDRKINSWNVLLNKFRMLKPKGLSKKKVTQVHEEFNEDDFNFNKVKDPTIWSGNLFNRGVSLYYNKFPYKDLQSLLVIEPKLNKEQFLTKENHDFVWQLCQALKNLYNLSFGYNSVGAFASVNHLHFHMMVGEKPLAVTDNQWVHNGGIEKYPANLFVFSDPDAAWTVIDSMNSKNIPYNLLYVPGKIYVFPRKFQGTYLDPMWSSGLGWHEFSGNFVVYDEATVNSLTDEIIRNALANASTDLVYNKV